jgi:uncharacterized protein
MSMRDRTERALSTRGWPRFFLWGIAPALCVMLPGPGAIAAFLWIVALLGIGRQSPRLLGVSRPHAWWRLIAYALLIAVFMHLVADYAIQPIAQWLTHKSPDVSQVGGFAGNWPKLALFLLISWLVGALLEETVFRGFMIGYGTMIFGERYRWPLALFSSAVFGFSHLYQGAAGVILTGIVGFMLAAVFIISKKNLPLVMLAHGFVDTISMFQVFFGLSNGT